MSPPVHSARPPAPAVEPPEPTPPVMEPPPPVVAPPPPVVAPPPPAVSPPAAAVPPALVPPSTGPVAPVEPDPLLRRAIEECRAKLPKNPGRALLARVEAQGTESDAKIAERLGMKLNTLLKNFGRARQFLLECLERRGVHLGGELSA